MLWGSAPAWAVTLQAQEGRSCPWPFPWCLVAAGSVQLGFASCRGFYLSSFAPRSSLRHQDLLEGLSKDQTPVPAPGAAGKGAPVLCAAASWAEAALGALRQLPATFWGPRPLCAPSLHENPPPQHPPTPKCLIKDQLKPVARASPWCLLCRVPAPASYGQGTWNGIKEG